MTIDEALAESRENIARNHSTEPCVVRRLVLEIERDSDATVAAIFRSDSGKSDANAR